MLSFAALIPLSLGLSTDAFAVSVALGAKTRNSAPHNNGFASRILRALQSGATFGIAEGLMCLLGFKLGAYFANFITAFDHWIALILLCLIGINMIRDGLNADDTTDADGVALRKSSMTSAILTAIATSIDSAAVGIALAMAGTSAFAALFIGITSFIISTIGFLIGPIVGAKLGHRAEIIGGLVLITIGVLIFIQHVWGG